MTTAKTFTTPPGRLVRGSLYKPQDKDGEGNPLTIKSGPNAGQPRVDYYIGVAIPKGAEQHWNQTAWGQLIWQTGQAAFPQGQANAPQFAWKVIDGDSTVPNLKGKRPCDQEGHRGCWILNFGGGYAPRIYNSNGTAPITEPDAVKLGYYVQVAGSVEGNGSLQRPGVYLNHSMVALAGYGPEIVLGPDPTQAGFGQAPLPAGASAAPVSGVPAGAGVPPAAQPHVPPAAAYTPPPHVPAAAAPAVPPPVAPPVAPPPVPPNPAILAVPAKRMSPTAIAAGYTYESFVQAGWNDQQMIAAGHLLP